MNEIIERNFAINKLNERKIDKQKQVVQKAKELAYLIDELCINSREKSLANTKLEECVMWANKAIENQE